jgi:hypothetical protein
MNKISAYLLTLMMTLAPHSLAGQAKKPAPPVAPASGVSKTVSLLEKSGYKYTKLKEGVWQIRFEGKNLKEFIVNISSISDLTLLFVDLAGRDEVNLSDELSFKLLELNDSMDAVKFALSDKSLYVRCEVHERILDLPEFKFMIGQLSAAVDEAFPQIQPFLNRK